MHCKYLQVNVGKEPVVVMVHCSKMPTGYSVDFGD